VIQSLLYAPPPFPEGATDVRQWISIVEEMNDTWEEAHKSTLHQLNMASTLCLFYAYQKSPKASNSIQQFLSVLSDSSSRFSSPLGYIVALSLFNFVIALYQLSLHCDTKSIDFLLKSFQQAEKVLLILKNRWAFAEPIHFLALGHIYWLKNSPKKALSAWRSGINRVDQISDNLKYLKAILQVRIVRCSQGSDALKTEASEFLQSVGARTELTLLTGEDFSPIPINDDDDEEEIVFLQD